MDGLDSKFPSSTMKGDTFMEVVAGPKTGAIAKPDKITDADDLKVATSRKAAMAKAKVGLLVTPKTRSRSILAHGRSASIRSCRTVMRWPK